jgi:hypothetical protein
LFEMNWTDRVAQMTSSATTIASRGQDGDEDRGKHLQGQQASGTLLSA